MNRSNYLIHVCESCGITEILTPDEAFEKGWDYPPGMGKFKIISPRTCPNCPINQTVWYEIVCRGKSVSELSAKQREVFMRIMQEPESITPREEGEDDKDL